MKWRFGLIISLVFLRLLGCWFSVLEYKDEEKLKISGNVNIIEQSYKNCISKIDNFQIIWQSKCAFFQGDGLIVIGSTKTSLIERLLGQVSLVDPSIIKVESNNKSVLRKGIKLTNLIDELRQRMIKATVTQLPEPEAGLTLGVVLGVKTDLEQKFYDNLVKSGTIHMVVASGYNLMIVGGAALGATLYIVRRKWASVTAVIVMFLYAAIAGNEPPVIRAALMGSLIFIGTAIGRRSTAGWSLFLAGVVMVLIDPVMVTSASFQLSMAASVGLLLVAPRLNQLLYGVEEIQNSSRKILMRTELTTTVATMIMTAPLIWWHFGRLQWVALFSNILILPLVPLLMGVGGLATLVGLVSVDLARPIYWGVWVIARLIVELVQIFGA